MSNNPIRPRKRRQPKKPNFYARIMDKKRQDALERAQELRSLDDDLALARTETYATARRVNPDPRLVFYGLRTVATIQAVRDRHSGPSDGNLYDAVRRALTVFDDPKIPSPSIGEVPQIPSPSMGEAPKIPSPSMGEG